LGWRQRPDGDAIDQAELLPKIQACQRRHKGYLASAVPDCAQRDRGMAARGALDVLRLSGRY